jgi:preprotein translocase subunit SecE
MDSPSDAEKWDVNRERVFLENLMQTRFNFFLVVFGLWMVTVASITPKLPKLVFLGFGIVICSLLWLTIRRICKKVIAALGLLGTDAKHPMKQVASAAGEDRFIRWVTSNQLIGYIIPVLCISLFVLWFLYIVMSPAEKRVHIRVHNVTLSVAAMLVRNPDRSPLGING